MAATRGVSSDVPRALRALTLLHAALDAPFGLALLVSPAHALSATGVSPDPLFARLYGAALVAVAVVSVRVRDEGVVTYRVVLTHKVAWAVAAGVGCAVAGRAGAGAGAWLFAATFGVFAALWGYWLRRLRA